MLEADGYDGARSRRLQTGAVVLDVVAPVRAHPPSLHRQVSLPHRRPARFNTGPCPICIRKVTLYPYTIHVLRLINVYRLLVK